MSQDPHQLQRFLDAQQHSFEAALAELTRGRKSTHWMWFIFPQLEGLGHSAMARRYAIASRQEAQAYLAHPTLGDRLRRCAQALLPHVGQDIQAIMGWPDDLKLRSSMTLFASIDGPGSVFEQVLDGFYQGQPDSRTLDALDALDD